MRRPLLLTLLLTGCQTTVGQYFADRGRDLSECFLLEVGFAPLTLGAGAKGGGVVHTGFVFGAMHPSVAVGWAYGLPRPVSARLCSGEGDVGLPILIHGCKSWRGRKQSIHLCAGLFPAIYSKTGLNKQAAEGDDPDLRWIWSDEANRDTDRWERVHVFDFEVSAYALLAGVRAGFSPGELVDFLLGWFGIDIAGDDARPPPPDRTEGEEPE